MMPGSACKGKMKILKASYKEKQQFLDAFFCWDAMLIAIKGVGIPIYFAEMVARAWGRSTESARQDEVAGEAEVLEAEVTGASEIEMLGLKGLICELDVNFYVYKDNF